MPSLTSKFRTRGIPLHMITLHVLSFLSLHFKGHWSSLKPGTMVRDTLTFTSHFPLHCNSKDLDSLRPGTKVRAIPSHSHSFSLPQLLYAGHGARRGQGQWAAAVRDSGPLPPGPPALILLRTQGSNLPILSIPKILFLLSLSPFSYLLRFSV